MDAAVRLDRVTKTYGAHTAVRDLSLTIPRGSRYGFLGPNGSGKTTTLRMILHIIAADSGTIEVLGQRGTRAANDRIGYLPEERGLYKKMTVRRQLAYYAALKGMPAAAAEREIGRWLELLGLEEWRDAKVEALSKGMGQKVQFIAAVVAKPELVILDEPFSGLDPVNREVLRDALLALSAEGRTLILSTHDMGLAEELCDEVFMIFRGDKVFDGTVDGVRARYGQAVLRVRTDGGIEALAGLPGVEQVLDRGRYQELRCRGDSQEVLRALAGRTAVRHFEEARPSLHEIFIRIAGPDADEQARAEGAGTRHP
jgi:ABC-2 type transport system ATP-binding protein